MYREKTHFLSQVLKEKNLTAETVIAPFFFSFLFNFLSFFYSSIVDFNVSLGRVSDS